jgi:hypothetical protein
MVASLALSGALATAAYADPLIADPAKALADRNQWAPQVQHKSFEWDAAKSRWGLKFDLDQQPGSGSEFKNVQAGAYFKLTPSLRVGAGVSLTDQQNLSNNNPLALTPPPPKVHMEMGFKF